MAWGKTGEAWAQAWDTASVRDGVSSTVRVLNRRGDREVRET